MGALPLGDHNHQGDFGEQFIQTLAVAANLDVVPKPHRDRRGVDWEITYPASDGRYRHPRILAQVKCWAVRPEQFTHKAADWRYPLRVHNLNLLAGRDWYEPRFLFLVVVPADEAQWTRINHEGMLLRYAAYWECFHDLEPVQNPGKDQKVTVSVPKDHLLTVSSLHGLFGSAFRDLLGES